MQVEFGALSPPLKEQLADAGLEPKEVACLQSDLDAITRLAVRGYIQEGVKVHCHREVLRRIRKAARAAQ